MNSYNSIHIYTAAPATGIGGWGKSYCLAKEIPKPVATVQTQINDESDKVKESPHIKPIIVNLVAVDNPTILQNWKMSKFFSWKKWF